MESDEYRQGYRDQTDWLREECPDLRETRRLCDLRSRLVGRLSGDQSYNRGGSQAAADYLAGLEAAHQ